MVIDAQSTIELRGAGARWRVRVATGGDAAFVVAITLIGAILRFAWLSWPTLWNDEVMTYSRVCGTHRQMLDALRDEPFGPLHYEIYWLLARVLTMTPAVMRLVPAVAGTLMVPAMYHLGRELLGRRVGRLACALAACSAFLLAYSRDAKMYMELWLAITVHVASLLTAMRVGFAGKGAWATAGWLLAGAAAIWLHVLGAFIVPLDLAIVLLHSKGGVGRTAVVVLALGVIVAGPLVYFVSATRVPVELQRRGWDGAGIYWVNDRAAGHTPFALLCDSAGAFAFGFSWIEQPNGRARLSAPVMVGAACALAVIGVVLVWSAVPRPGQRRASDALVDGFLGWRGVVLLALWIVVPVYAVYRLSSTESASLVTGLQAIVHQSAWVWIGLALGLVGASVAASSRWGRLSLGVICLPLLVGAIGVPVVWAFLGDASSPVGPPLWLKLDVPWAICSIAAVACLVGLRWVDCAASLRGRLAKAGRLAAGVGGVVVCCAGVDLLVANFPRNALWMPRYLGFLYPAVLVAVSALLLRLRSKGLRWIAMGGLLAVNLGMAGAHLFAWSEPPLDRVAADVVTSLVPEFHSLTYTPDTSHTFGPNAMGSIDNTCGLYYLVMASGKQLTPSQFRDRPTRAHFRLRETSDPYVIERDARVHPEANRVIVWDRVDGARRGVGDGAQDALAGWRLRSVDVFPVRSFWNWGFHYGYRRREYERNAE